MLELLANLQKESSRIVTAPLAYAASRFPGSGWVVERAALDIVMCQEEANP